MKPHGKLDGSQLRVLIVARHFPPLVSGGARRPYFLARGLIEAGAQVRVVAPALPDDIDGFIVPHPAPNPPHNAGAATPTLRDLLRRSLLLPDPDIRWAMRAARIAGENFTPDVLLTTSPPESVHVTGALLKRKLRCCWIADFRDNWLTTPLLDVRRNKLRKCIEAILARHLLAHADLVIAPEAVMLAEATAMAPRARAALIPQPGGLARAPIQAAEGEAITLLHCGSFTLSHDARSLKPLLELFSAARVIDQRFRLVLMGRLTPAEEAAARQTEGVSVAGVVPWSEAVAAQREADILVAAAAPDASVPPGKIAEYRLSGRPYITLGAAAWVDAGRGEVAADLEQVLALRAPQARIALAQQQATSGVDARQAVAALLSALAPLVNCSIAVPTPH